MAKKQYIQNFYKENTCKAAVFKTEEDWLVLIFNDSVSTVDSRSKETCVPFFTKISAN